MGRARRVLPGDRLRQNGLVKTSLRERLVCPRNLRSLRLFRDDSGATAVEYSLLAVLIAAVIVGVVAAIGTDVSGALQSFVAAF